MTIIHTLNWPTETPHQHITAPIYVFDMDGTIRYSKSGAKFIKDNADIALYDDVEPKLRELKHNGALLGIASNQGGVAYGIRTEKQAEADLHATFKLFKDGNPFDLAELCLTHPKGNTYPYNHRSLTRKPYYGMLVLMQSLAYQDGYVIDWDKSLIVGDRHDDRLMAEAAEVPFAWAWDFFGRQPTDEQYDTYVLELVERRKDGWPYCPSCGEDELASHAIDCSVETWGSVEKAIRVGIDAGMNCLYCGHTIPERKAK